MNKYQEALEHILGEIRMCRRNPERIEDLTKSLSLLQELVDKATPEKVIGEKGYSKCHNCETSAICKYCYECGKSLDWSEDE